MKKLKFVTTLFSFSLLTHPLYATYSTFEEYCTAMDSKKLPRTLMVGCGHSSKGEPNEGNHTHPDCWSVDIADNASYRPQFKHLTKEEAQQPESHEHWKEIEADEPLDITDSNVSLYSKKFKGAFDVIVLERPYDKTLNNPYTLYNTAFMLKSGGTLVIDTHSGYPLNAYEYPKDDSCDPSKITHTVRSFVNPERVDEASKISPILYSLENGSTTTLNKIKTATEELGQSFEDANYYNPETILKSVTDQSARFGIPITKDTQAIRLVTRLVPMAQYLTAWGFENVLPLDSAYQPWTATGEDIKTSRRSNLIVATKGSAITDELMKKWGSLIKKFK